MKQIKDMSKEELDEERDRVSYMINNISRITLFLLWFGIPLSFIAYRFGPEYNLYRVCIVFSICIIQAMAFGVCLAQIGMINKRLKILDSSS